MGSRARVVKRCEDSRGSLLLNEIAHNFVVEVLDRCPLDLFADVFLLLGLKGQFDEDLLEFLVDVVDAELLEGVILEDLEAVDVQDADEAGICSARGHGDVYTGNDPFEEIVVDGFGEGVSSRSSLSRVQWDVVDRTWQDREVILVHEAAPGAGVLPRLPPR